MEKMTGIIIHLQHEDEKSEEINYKQDNSKVLIEGRLSKRSESAGVAIWDTDWYILRKLSTERLNGRVILEQHAREPTLGDDIIMGIINISNDVKRISIISDTAIQALRNERNDFFPSNLNFTDYTKSEKAYSFTITTNAGIKHIYSALERKSFIRWIRTLNRIKFYMDPFQVAKGFRVLVTLNLDENQLSQIWSFWIEHYCDSARVHLIPMKAFCELYAICTGTRDDVEASCILNKLRDNIPSVSMGWDSVATAAEQQIDKGLAKLIKFVSPLLPNLSTACGCVPLMTKIIRDNANHALTAGEIQYIGKLMERIARWNLYNDRAQVLDHQVEVNSNSKRYVPRQ